MAAHYDPRMIESLLNAAERKQEAQRARPGSPQSRGFGAPAKRRPSSAAPPQVRTVVHRIGEGEEAKLLKQRVILSQKPKTPRQRLEQKLRRDKRAASQAAVAAQSTVLETYRPVLRAAPSPKRKFEPAPVQPGSGVYKKPRQFE